MRARKLAVAIDEPSPDFAPDAFPAFAEDEPRSTGAERDEPALDRVCIACGGDGFAHDGCPHDEIARVDAPSRVLLDALVRLRRAAAEHRAAARALRTLVLADVARGRGDLESTPQPKPEPCPKCLLRDAEEANLQKPPKRRSKGGETQQALPFKVA